MTRHSDGPSERGERGGGQRSSCGWRGEGAGPSRVGHGRRGETGDGRRRARAEVFAVALTREHVDRDAARHERLCGGNVHVTRSDDGIARADRARAVRQRRDRLRPSHRDQLVCLGDVGGGERHRCRPRRGDADARAAGDPCGDGGHQDCRRQRVPSAGRVAARVLHRRQRVPCLSSRDWHGDLRGGGALRASKVADPLGGAREAVALLLRDGLPRRLELDLAPVHQGIARAELAKALGKAAQRWFTLGADRLHDGLRGRARLGLDWVAADSRHLVWAQPTERCEGHRVGDTSATCRWEKLCI